MHRLGPIPKSKPKLLLSLLGQRLRRIGPLYVGVFFGVASALYYLERGMPDSKYTRFSDAIWFSVVTMSTVGYGDVYPVTGYGRFVAGAFILFTLTTIGFLLTAFNEAIVEVNRMEEAGMIGTRMKNHVLVCGYSPIVRVALTELIAADRQIALLCEKPEDIPIARQYCVHGDVFITSGDPTDEVLKERLNAHEAETAVIGSSDDTLNLVTALHLRQLNPKMRIVCALQREELRSTMMASGVTYVMSPNELSGRLVASAAFEPEVAHFVEEVTSGANGTHDLQQFSAAPLNGMTVADVRKHLDEIDGPLLVAVAQRHNGEFRLLAHPPRDVKLTSDDHIIVVTDDEQAARLQAKHQVKQGR
jgi:voltage-gated potassium channel